MTVLRPSCATLVAALLATAAQAEVVQVTVDTSKPWLSYATVFELPTLPGADRGNFVYGQFYDDGFYATPPGMLDGKLVQLRPNTSLATADTDASNPFFGFWWQDTGGATTPNKIVQDGFYIQDDSLAGHDIVFTGFVVANTLVSPYGTGARAFIADTVGDGYSIQALQYTPLIAGQSFSVSLTVAEGHHVAYGIELVGPNARASDLAGLGVVQVSAVPEPAAALLLSMGLAGLLLHQRRR